MLNTIAILSSLTKTRSVPDDRSSINDVSIDKKEDSSETVKSIDRSALETIQNELDAFEKRLKCGYSTLDTLPETELKLPMLFVDNFSRIFSLWKDNSVFKNSIPSQVFYEIFSLMFRSLNGEAAKDEQTENNLQSNAQLSNLTGVCDICDEEFEIIQNDAEKSLAEHELTKTHIEALNLLSKIGTSNEKESDFKPTGQTVTQAFPPSNANVKLSRKCVNTLRQDDFFLKWIEGNTFVVECYLCDKACTDQNDLLNHCNSKTHKKLRADFFSKPQSTSRKQVEFNDDLIFAKGKSVYCVLCRCVETKQNRNKHTTEEYHIGWKNLARKIVNLEEPYFYEINKSSKIAFCELCNMKFTSSSGVIPHCQTKSHILYKNFADEVRFLYLNSSSFRK